MARPRGDAEVGGGAPARQPTHTSDTPEDPNFPTTHRRQRGVWGVITGRCVTPPSVCSSTPDPVVKNWYRSVAGPCSRQGPCALCPKSGCSFFVGYSSGLVFPGAMASGGRDYRPGPLRLTRPDFGAAPWGPRLPPGPSRATLSVHNFFVRFLRRPLCRALWGFHVPPFDKRDPAANKWVSGGGLEAHWWMGWHNTHHAFPTSAPATVLALGGQIDVPSF